MQIVINIPEKLYSAIKEDTYSVHHGVIYDAVREGTPIPKGHGGLIDADELALQIAELSGDILNPCYGVTYSDIKNAHVIIKADKEKIK